MFGRIFNGLVVVFWMIAMTWLLAEKVIPPMLGGDPPDYQSVLEPAARRKAARCLEASLEGTDGRIRGQPGGSSPSRRSGPAVLCRVRGLAAGFDPVRDAGAVGGHREAVDPEQPRTGIRHADRDAHDLRRGPPLGTIRNEHRSQRHSRLSEAHREPCKTTAISRSSPNCLADTPRRGRRSNIRFNCRPRPWWKARFRPGRS